jgi:hypothetical protein
MGMNKALKSMAVILVLVLSGGMVTGCVEFLTFTIETAIEAGKLVVELGQIAVEGAQQIAAEARARKDELPLYGMKRISKGNYTVRVIATRQVKYSEAVRNNAINLVVQFMGYESYDFQMTSVPSFRKKTYAPYWSYSFTMPGSIPVVKDVRFADTIADTTWTAVTNTSFDKKDYIKDIAYGDGRFVAVGRGDKMAYSSDGVTWTAVTNSTFGKGWINAIAYGNNRFVAVGGEGKTAYSSDGINWTAVKTTPFRKNHIGSIVYGNGMFVARAYEKGMAYSPDGITWTAVKNTPFKRKDSIDIAHCGGRFFAFERYESDRMAYSTDGITWTAVKSNPLGRKNRIYTVAHANGQFVALGNQRLAYSSDGITWTAVETNLYVPIFLSYTNINDITYGDGTFVIVGDDGKAAYSSDLISWTTIADSAFPVDTHTRSDYGYDGDILAVAYGNGRFVATGRDGRMAYWDGDIE